MNSIRQRIAAIEPGDVGQLARKMIESNVGDVAWAACWMHDKGFVTNEWAKEMIEKMIGDSVGAAFHMCNKGYASKEWADKMKRLHGEGNP